jgi:hypothetical protein
MIMPSYLTVSTVKRIHIYLHSFTHYACWNNMQNYSVVDIDIS